MTYLLGAAGVLGAGLLYAKLFLKGRKHEGHKAPLPTEGGVKCGSFKNAQGLKIRTYQYDQTKDTATKPTAVVVLVHGIGSHAHWGYMKQPGFIFEGSWVDQFNKRGLAVHMLDLQGHGRSEAVGGRMCMVDKFEHYALDVIQFVKLLREQYDKGTKIFVCGGSMGGCVVADVGERMGDSVDGIVLLSPMLSLEQVKAQPINKLLLPLLSVVSSLLPLLPVGEVAKNERYPHLSDAYAADPLSTTEPPRAHMSAECLGAVDRVMAAASELTAPTVLFHSNDDTMTDPNGSVVFHSKLTQKDKGLHMLDNGMWHVLSNEPGQEAVNEMVADWVLERA